MHLPNSMPSESTSVLTPGAKPLSENQEGCYSVEVTFWHMVTQGLGAWVFKDLSKNPSIWTPVWLLHAC